METENEKRKAAKKVIATSYFASKLIKGCKVRLVSIALSTRYVKCERYKKLAPTREMIELAHAGNTDEYVRRYRAEILSKLDPLEVYDELDGAILLCWEKAGSFCHRRLVAEWLEEATGKKVPELDAELMKKFEFIHLVDEWLEKESA